MKAKVNKIEQIDCNYVIDMEIYPSFKNAIITSGTFSLANYLSSKKENTLKEIKKLKNG